MARSKEEIIFKPGPIVDKNGHQVGGLQEALRRVSCNLFFDTEIGAVILRDIATGDLKYAVLENGSLVFKDTKQEVCDAKTAW